MQISPFMHEPKIITTLSARILQKSSDIWKSSIPMKNSMRLPTHPPWQTAGSLTRQDSVFRQEPLPHPSEVRFLLYHRSHTDHFGTSSGHPACDELRQLHPLLHGMPWKALSHERFNPWRCKSYLTQKKEVLNEEEKIFFVRRRLSSDVMSARNAVPLMKMQHTLPFRKRVQTGSPVWKEKHWNRFQTADLQKNMENMLFLAGQARLTPKYGYHRKNKSPSSLYRESGDLFLLRFIYFRKKTG